MTAMIGTIWWSFAMMSDKSRKYSKRYFDLFVVLAVGFIFEINKSLISDVSTSLN